MFKAVTKFSGKFKSLFEILFQNMITVNFKIDKMGLFIEHFTTQNILISIFLPSENFDEYIFDNDEPLYVGVGSHVNKDFFKYVKNKDTLTMSINKPFIFDFEKKNDMDNVVHSFSINTENIQNIIPIKHKEYECKPIKISSINFNQMCRSFNTPTLNITKKFGQINFSFESGISIKNSSFGNKDLSDKSLYHQTYYSDQFNRITKISSFSSEPIEIYIEEYKPLFIFCKNKMGSIKIFIYSKDLNFE